MTWLRAVVVLLALSACGCGSAGKTGDNGSVPARHYLVYTKLIDEPGISIADADGGDPRLLVRDGFNPAISPDGRRVAYSAYCERESYDCSNVFIVDTGSRSEPRLLGKRLGGTIRWTSDSKRLVVETSSTENVHELAAIDVESGKVTRLADGKFWGWSLSLDGERIV